MHPDPGPLALRPALWAHLKPPAQDPGPAGHLPYMTDAEYADSIGETLNSAQDPREIRVFAYGSLIWKPGFSWTERRVGMVRGWRRAFCLETARWRGTPDRPGLMMALVPGGACRGVVYRLDPATLSQDLDRLWRRELGVKPLNHDPRWVEVETDDGGIVRALAFTANPGGRSYVGVRGPEETADVIARAVGMWGPCAEYLYETALGLEELGIRDEEVWRLQALVAERLEREAAGA
jgi:cation transport protein ChaC